MVPGGAASLGPGTLGSRAQVLGSGAVSEPPPIRRLEGDDEPDARVDWEVPEVGGVVIVAAVGLLVLGGLVTGIAAAAGAPTTFGPGSGNVELGSSVQSGAAWADPVLAMVLLGVLGACWWWAGTWSNAPGEPGARERDVAEVHVERARMLARSAVAALVVTLAGSLALLVGLLLSNSQAGNQSSLVWSGDIAQVASVLAVAATVAGGTWVLVHVRTSPARGGPQAQG